MATSASKTSTAKAVAAYLGLHSAGDTIGGGALYTALYLLTLQAAGLLFTVEGAAISIFKDGKLAAVASTNKANVLFKLVDPAGNSMLVKKDLRVEQILSWAQTGKVQATCGPLYLTSPKARKAVAAGKLPEGWPSTAWAS